MVYEVSKRKENTFSAPTFFATVDCKGKIFPNVSIIHREMLFQEIVQYFDVIDLTR